jgi:2-polyprenyl-3-methyl-5-hydroxy-6-metoxy-1,4-benzoquinol methylase
MTARDHWDRIASTSPFYAVLAEARFFGTPDPNVVAEFHRSGDAYVARVIREIEIHFGPVDHRVRTVLEFGCGPGRLACAYARRGFRVTAADVSPVMLAQTRAAAAPNGLDIELLLDTELFATERQFDLVSCVLVLQHLSEDDARSVIDSLVRHVRPGGLLHLQFPYRTHRAAASRLALAVRQHVPGVNRIANAARKRSADVPLLVPRVHSIDDVVSELGAQHCVVVHFDATRENELETARLIAVHGTGDAMRSTDTHASADVTPGFIDVRELMRATPLDEWNRRAEAYFATLTTYESQLAKPFSAPGEAPALLMNAGAVVEAARVLPGMTVVDFGAGTGWLTRGLAQLGCRVISMDVSPTALQIGRNDYDTRPLVGAQPAPTFLQFNGTRIDLDDGSVDRVICFDSFHHVPNPELVLREFARILKPGGLGAFSEPGPRHSRSAQSQFEMRTYGVLENDIDLHALWPIARDAGLVDLKVGVFDGNPKFVSLDEYEDLLSGGSVLADAARWLRDFLHDVRLFTLRKAGEERLDSRTATALRCDLEIELRGDVRANEPIAVHAFVRNTGSAVWLPSPALPGGVCLGAHLFANDTLVTFDYHWQPIPGDGLRPGEAATLDFQLPPLAPGSYVLEFDCIAQNVAWFATNGSATKRLALDIR